MNLIAYSGSQEQQTEETQDGKGLFLILGDLGKAVGELVTVMTEDTSKTNGQRAPPPAFK